MKLKLISDVFVSGKMRKKDEVLNENDVSEKDFKTLIVSKHAVEIKEDEPKKEPKDEPKAPKSPKKDEKTE